MAYERVNVRQRLTGSPLIGFEPSRARIAGGLDSSSKRAAGGDTGAELLARLPFDLWRIVP